MEKQIELYLNSILFELILYYRELFMNIINNSEKLYIISFRMNKRIFFFFKLKILKSYCSWNKLERIGFLVSESIRHIIGEKAKFHSIFFVYSFLLINFFIRRQKCSNNLVRKKFLTDTGENVPKSSPVSVKNYSDSSDYWKKISTQYCRI